MLLDTESAIDADIQEPETTGHNVKVTLKEIEPGTYEVHWAGRKILSDSRDPEFDTCRYLKSVGITGQLETYREGIPYPCMRLNIEKAARLMTDTNKAGTPVTRPYRSKRVRQG